jgi:hypothetical protein
LITASTLARRYANELSRDSEWGGFNFGLNNGFDVLDNDKNVLWLEISVNNSTLSVHIVEPK